MIFADHRGQGGSDKPQDASAYALATRVAAFYDADDLLLPHILELLRSAAPKE